MQHYILLRKGEDPTKKIVCVNGVCVDIEWTNGSIRYYDDTCFKTLMTADYGYLKHTTGADGDKLDVYVGRNHESKKVFKLTQVKPATGKFDELKWCIGFDDIGEAKLCYLEMMPAEFFGKIEEVPWSEFFSKVPKSIIIKKSQHGEGHHCTKTICNICGNITTCRCSTPKTDIRYVDMCSACKDKTIEEIEQMKVDRAKRMEEVKKSQHGEGEVIEKSILTFSDIGLSTCPKCHGHYKKGKEHSCEEEEVRHKHDPRKVHGKKWHSHGGKKHSQHEENKGGAVRLPDGSGFFVGTVGKKKEEEEDKGVVSSDSPNYKKGKKVVLHVISPKGHAHGLRDLSHPEGGLHGKS